MDILSRISKILNRSIQSKIGWLFVDEREATFGHIQQNEPKVLKKITFGIHSKHRADNQSQRKIRLIKEAKMAFHHRICEVMNEFFMRFEDLHIIFVGGSEPIEEKIVKNDILDNGLEGKITFIEVSSDKGREGIKEFFTEIRKILIK